MKNIKMKEIEQIREKLLKAENPIIFFDDDPDGLCSYLLIKKFIGKGKGISIRGEPWISEKYLPYIKDHDLVIILDKPMIKEEFLDNVKKPVIWIDHHAPQNVKGIIYFNPRLKDNEDNRPTTYWCYEITKENLQVHEGRSPYLWIAFTGIVADYFLDYYKEFKKEYPDLVIDNPKEPTDLMYKSKVGKLIKIFSHSLKGKTKIVNKNISLLEKIKTPYELLNKESEEASELVENYERIEKEFEKMVIEAEKHTAGKIIKFIYGNDKYSFTAELALYLSYKFPNKFILVCRDDNDKLKCSIRGHKKELPPIVNKSLIGVRGYGGGHKYACGATIEKEDFEKFWKTFEEECEK